MSKPLRLTYTIFPRNAMAAVRVLSDIESELSMLPDSIEYDGKTYPFPEDDEEKIATLLSDLLDK